MLGKYRSWYERTFRGLGEKLARLKITPNQLTILSLIPAVASCYFFSQQIVLWGVVCMAVSFFIDALDGSLARATGMTTKIGKVLDPVVDRYVEFLVLFGLALGEMAEFWATMYCIFGMLMASYARARAESVENINLLSVGAMERQEKFLLLIVGIILFNYYTNALTYTLVIIGTFSHITVLQRLIGANRRMEE